MKKEKSLGVNALLNCVKSLLSVIFPLITYPYVLRVLQVENIGKVDFSNSIVNYFVLFAGLGIANYAIREGSAYRDDKEKLEEFASEMFSINCISSLISFVVLLTVAFTLPELEMYKAIILIQSFTIIGNLVGVVWLFSILEDYLYITIRAIVVHIIALLLMFILVRSEGDYLQYAAISVVANAGANIYNFFYAQKFIKIRFTKKLSLRKHIKSILVIFFSTIASTIYVNSDKTILGILTNDYYVGLYSCSVNVYTILKICMIAIIQVSLPRLSNYIACNRIDDYNKSATYVFKLFSVLLMPVVTGVFMVSDDIITVVGGTSYLNASASLKILSISLLFSILATFYTNAVLLPMKKEKIVMSSTIISAVVNVLINILILKTTYQNGAAFTTLLAELIMSVFQYYYARRYFKLKLDFKYIISVVVGCIWIIIVTVVVNMFISSFIIQLCVKMIISIIGYVIILLLLKNEIVINYWTLFKKKISR